MSSAQEFAEQIAASFNSKPRRHGREWRTFCCVHEADGGMHKPSFAVWDKGGGRFAFKCQTGCSNASVRAALKDRGISVPGSGPMTTEQQMAAAKANEERRVASLRNAQTIVMGAVAITTDDPVDIYLRSRGLSVIARNEFWTLMRSKDPTARGLESNTLLVGTVCDLSTLREKPIRSTGIMTLSLNPDGTPRLHEGKKLRSVVGTLTAFGVPFGKVGPHVVVAEGLETAISALILTGADFCVATLSASNMPNLAIPEWVSRVTIAADNDAPGRAAAQRLGDALEGLFVVDTRLWAGPDGWDANDELMKQRGLK